MNQDRYWHMVFCIMFLIPDMNNEIFFIFLKKWFFTPILAIFCLRQQNHFSGFSRKPLNRFSRNFYTSFLSLMCRGRTSNILKGAPPPKNEKKSLFQFLLNLKLVNICELMQKTASPYLSPFQNGGRMNLTCTAILLCKNGHFLGQTRV